MLSQAESLTHLLQCFKLFIFSAQNVKYFRRFCFAICCALYSRKTSNILETFLYHVYFLMKTPHWKNMLCYNLGKPDFVTLTQTKPTDTD